MKPVSSASDNDDSLTDSLPAGLSPAGLSPSEDSTRLSQDIEQLEAEKARLQTEVTELRQGHAQLQKVGPDLTLDGPQPNPHPNSHPNSGLTPERLLDLSAEYLSSNQLSVSQLSASQLSASQLSAEHSETTPISEPPPLEIGPRLPGEKEVSPSSAILPPAIRPTQPKAKSKAKTIELPTPATSEQRRQRVIQRQAQTAPLVRAATKRGLILSAIATALTAWHYGLVSTLVQGGSWLGLGIGQLGVGFVPAVALLWLRMLVMVPALVMLATQLYKPTWDDLQDWFYTREQVFIPIIGSGTALFFSQVLLYQSIGLIGPVIGTALLFLYPLSAIPLGLGLSQEKMPTPFGLVALVAIAMGGFLIAQPLLTADTSGSVGLGIAASLSLSLYIVLTNLSYRQQCHPIPTGIVQFSTVAVLSSVVLLVTPLKMVSISWLSFCLWGLFIGFLMLIAYLFTYASLRTIGTKTAMVAASTPLAILILSWGFKPTFPLEIIQWTGISLVALGGIALSKEKITQRKG